MALGFIKKIFSFGSKKVEEPEKQAEPQNTLPPVETPVAPAALPEFLRREEALPEPVSEKQAERLIEPEPQPEPIVPEIPVEPEPQPPAPVEPEPLPEPTPVAPPEPIEPPAPAPQEVPPQPEPEPETPAEPVPEQPAPVPTPVEPPAPPIEIPAPEPEPEPEVPVEVPEAPPVEIPEPAPSVPTPSAEKAVPIEVTAPETIAAPVSSPSSGKVIVAKKVEHVAPPSAEVARTGWFQRLKTGLSRSSRELGTNISSALVGRELNEEVLEDLEEVLIRADLGVETAIRITDALSTGRFGRSTTEADVRAVMASEVEKVLGPVAMPLELDLSHKPHVILVVGVNGTGKTTTIGKLAAKLTSGGLSVMLAAGDTFRAAAIEQLKIWGDRTGSPVISSKIGADAPGLAFEAFKKAKEAGSDVLVIDTAGRLQNKAELMAELEKMVRVLKKLDPDAPHTVLLTVDATTGQNAMNQVEIFKNIAGVNGLVMTKLDGTARGGILVSIAAKHKLPVYFIGVGEQIDDLEPFSAGDFAKAIAGTA
ncbi:signal recognition particle-docking protein FtsY [Mesorhizobium sp. SB112]|uniref:signal recognition particle-docking protein FtsY n=1 Tax=Mesorhizobium sp. SB112 TaxID=3151853 RepID=UPI003266BF1E